MRAAASKVRTPVLIVGGGPVGLYASSLLSASGVPSLLAERSSRGSPHPRAHLINSRSMELLRQLGVEDAIRTQTPPIREWSHFRYCSSLLGPQIAEQDHMATGAWRDLCEATSSPLAHLSQPKLEAILRAEAERRAATSGAQLLAGYTCVGFEQHADGVRAELQRSPGDGVGEAEEEGRPDRMVVEAEQLLACDGAHSPIRRALGLELRGPPALQHFKSIHFVAPALAEAAAERPAMLYFVFGPSAIAVLVAHNIAQGEWVAQIPFFPGLQQGELLDAAACESAVSACIGGGPGGRAAVDFEVRVACVTPVTCVTHVACAAHVLQVTPRDPPRCARARAGR